MTLSKHPHKKGEKPRIHTFSTTSKCPAWVLRWAAAGFDPIILPTLNNPALAQSYGKRAEHFLKRVKERENAPSLDGYLRWIATMIVAPETQYVFMVQPNIFPGDLAKTGLINEGIVRYVNAEMLVLMAGSDAIMGTVCAFRRACDIMVGDYGVTKDNATDAFIVKRLQEQMIGLVIEVPCCKDQGEEGWMTSPLIRATDPHTLPATPAFMGVTA